MIEYRITRHNDKILPEMGKENWQLIQILESQGKMYWSRQIQKTKNAIKGKETPERKEFINFYRKNITNNGSYGDPVIRKYEIVLEEHSHKQIMDNLKDYKIFLEINKSRPPLQVTTYINQKRFLDKWEVVKDQSRKYINDIFKEKELNADEIDYIMSEIKNYELKHSREVTDGVVRNMIKQLLNK